MLYIGIGLIVILVYLLTRLISIKKEMKRATRQLHELNEKQTDKKLDIRFYDKDIEKLVKEINHQIDITKRAAADKRRTENELKQAISHISHDIRTPMTSILGYIQFLEVDEISPELRKEYTQIIKNGALRLKVLLEDFFELSIIEQADYPMNLEMIKLNHVVFEVLLGFYEEFKKRDLAPMMEIPDEEIVIKADLSAVKRVIENLVVNAIKHASGSVSIRLEQSAASVQLTISNATDLLSTQDLEHLFDRFYKADQTRTGKGAGLGLPIAKSLMEKMNGRISAKLEQGQLSIICSWER
ncbi:HAMP domain-containing sensor histidine kinase [Lysinibacillus fusiformis]|nr:HAMP domain-containing sensor histidine kinase [Lysinibacillus fusiformis]